MPNKEPQTMDELVAAYGMPLVPFKQGDVIEVSIITISKSRILVDVQGLCLGIIPSREFSFDFSELQPGDKVIAYVLSVENDDGNVILSLKRADRERLWRTLQEKTDSGELITVNVAQANRGGLIVQYGDVEGFLPVSQLASSHYPRISDGNRDKILSKLNEIVGQTLRVKIISFDRAANKLIFSEKAAGDSFQEEVAKKYQIGQRLTGKIAGVVDFGIFVNIGEIEGLVHISEVSWDRVENLSKLFNKGDEIEVMVIGVEGGRISLSIKRLQADPWTTEVAKFKVGEIVEGEVTRATPFGAFVKISPHLDGMAQASDITKEGVTAKDILEEGKKYPFKILTIEPASRKINLSFSAAEPAKTKKTTPKTKTAKSSTITKSAAKTPKKGAKTK